MKIHPVVAQLFHADGQTDMTKLIVGFRNFANAPKSEQKYTYIKIRIPQINVASHLLKNWVIINTRRFDLYA
jgi:hypothetical protein